LASIDPSGFGSSTTTFAVYRPTQIAPLPWNSVPAVLPGGGLPFGRVIAHGSCAATRRTSASSRLSDEWFARVRSRFSAASLRTDAWSAATCR
jgi:hypothetical protein